MPRAKSLKPGSRCIPNKVYGIDFSGARDAGNKIWIASARVLGTRIEVEECYQAKYLPDSATDCERCLNALRQFISKQRACACGLDFPFSLPRRLVEANTWEEFVLSFGSRYLGPEKFKQSCWETAGGCEERRGTDRENKTPFSPYNRRLYRQTYYGIRDVLAPLVRDKVVSVLPMQSGSPAKPWLLEVCPASTLERMGLRRPYKGSSKDMDKKANRTQILEEFENAGLINISSSALRATILDNPGGDALDSIIAAFATFRAIGSSADSSASTSNNSMLEGHIYI